MAGWNADTAAGPLGAGSVTLVEGSILLYFVIQRGYPGRSSAWPLRGRRQDPFNLASDGGWTGA